MPRLLVAALAAVLLLATLYGPAAARVTAGDGIEDYAPYQPQNTCNPRPKAGTVALATWIVRRLGGEHGGIARDCGSGGKSEHKEGRAFDWRLDATRRADRATAKEFLALVKETDRRGNTDALARRMGIMYVIWNDKIYSAWNGFRRSDYLSSSCRNLERCSATLRHRDHVHISLSWRGALGRTSWYERRAD